MFLRPLAAACRVQNVSRLAIGKNRENGLPHLADAQANLNCVIDAMLAYGTHSIVIARVLQVRSAIRSRRSSIRTGAIYECGLWLMCRCTGHSRPARSLRGILKRDVAIVGFGATGACAAIEAADAGAKVMLFERNSGSGGASGLSGGEIYIGGNGGTDVQRAAGFEDSTEDFAAYLKAAGGPCVDDAKCELYGREALNHFAWLKAQGVPYRGNYLPGNISSRPTTAR